MAFGIAIVSAVVAVVSAIVAGLSWAASRRSAEAAERSATAAEKALNIQAREADAAEETRRRDELADVVPLRWEPRPDAEHPGLVVMNNGPAVARDIVVYERSGGQARKWQWPALGEGQTKGLMEHDQPVSDEEFERPGHPPSESADSYVRLEWINADGSSGSTDWRAIQHR